MSGTNYYMNLAFVIASFILPWALLMVPLIALAMQVHFKETRAGHSLFFSRFALRSFFIHGSLSLYR